MSDLISRKAVMDWLRDLQAQAIINSHNGTLVDATIVAAVNNFIDFVVQVPTAFDVDKVVGELEKEVLGKATHHEYDNGIYKAISIVKGAVKDV